MIEHKFPILHSLIQIYIYIFRKERYDQCSFQYSWYRFKNLIYWCGLFKIVIAFIWFKVSERKMDAKSIVNSIRWVLLCFSIKLRSYNEIQCRYPIRYILFQFFIDHTKLTILQTKLRDKGKHYIENLRSEIFL